MSIKQKALDTSIHIWTLASKTTNHIFTYLTKKAVDVYSSEKLHDGFAKVKEFYNDNKEVCLIGATVATIWVVTKVARQKDEWAADVEKGEIQGEQDKQKQKKKKHTAPIPITNKTFMDEQGVEFFPDQPSTDIVHRDSVPKKKPKTYEMSSQEDEKNDRIFFQMYNAYGVTENQ